MTILLLLVAVACFFGCLGFFLGAVIFGGDDADTR